MKRKLIDLDDSTFETLSVDAKDNNTNLKNYIEDILNRKARQLEENAASYYRFNDSKEPSDKELSVIMAKSAEIATERNNRVLSAFYDELEEAVKSIN